MMTASSDDGFAPEDTPGRNWEPGPNLCGVEPAGTFGQLDDKLSKKLCQQIGIRSCQLGQKRFDPEEQEADKLIGKGSGRCREATSWQTFVAVVFGPLKPQQVLLCYQQHLYGRGAPLRVMHLEQSQYGGVWPLEKMNGDGGQKMSCITL
ncbi:hypothetical protein pipiens_003338 [Culex pipiens pipiens]|uniref:Uncharacterized protein n=1 Tax=Culex pipiens pipiens TaxID=38569 RepID=A0ABD1CZU8_CULPP